jgi:dTDP-glucose 4,6-dehydratase
MIDDQLLQMLACPMPHAYPLTLDAKERDVVQIAEGELTCLYSHRTNPDRLRPDKSEVRRLLADNRRARDFLGWIPKVSLDEGLQRTIDWFRSHLTRYQVRQYQV